MSEELLALADDLYARPLAEFTPARDALVREHRGSDLAGALKQLRKPSTSAWVVNLLVRGEPDQVAQVLEVGRALRDAQEGMDAGELRELTKQRRALTAAVTTRARRLAREEGTRVSEAVAGQVEATLTAAMLDPGAADAVRSGLLVQPLVATGVEPVDAAAAVALPAALGFTATPRAEEPTETEPPALHVVPDPDADAKARREARRDAEEQLAAARREHADADTALQDATADVERLEARALQLQAELDELRSRVADVEGRQDDNDDELADAEDVRAEAADAAGAAAEAVTRAEAAVQRLD